MVCRSIVFGFLFLSSIASAALAEECALEGSGYIKVACADASNNVQVTFEGMDAMSANDISFSADGAALATGTSPVNKTAFERIDEGIFSFLAEYGGSYIVLSGIPRTFAVTKSKGPHGSEMLSGTFRALTSLAMTGAHDHNDEIVSCKVEILDCPRKKIP